MRVRAASFVLAENKAPPSRSPDPAATAPSSLRPPPTHFKAALLRPTALLQRILYRTTATNNTAVVLAGHGHSQISIDLSYVEPVPPNVAKPPPEDQRRVLRKSFGRDSDQPAQKTLDRMRMLAAPPRPKAGPRLTPAQILSRCPPAAAFDANGLELDPLLNNSDFWNKAAVLDIGGTKVRVKYNLPTVTLIKPPSVVYAGVPALCSSIQVLFSTKEELTKEWRLLPKTAPPAGELPAFAEFARQRGELVGEDVIITPKVEWVGRRLVFLCRPKLEDALWTATEVPAVEAPQAGFEANKREAKLRPHPERPDATRVVSYNVLHSGYVTAASLESVFVFCDAKTIDIAARKCRIVQELQRYNADIVCLQEVGRDVFEGYYKTVLQARGYEPALALKNGGAREGVAIAYRRARYTPVADAVKLSLNWGTCKQLLPALAEEIEQGHPHVRQALGFVPSAATYQVLVDNNTGKKVIVSNTHLYYHPDGCHIRAIQCAMLMTVVQQEAAAHDAQIIACGDYNFTRPTAGYRLATRGIVLPDDVSWGKGLKYWWARSKTLAEDGTIAAEAGADDDEFDMVDLDDQEDTDEAELLKQAPTSYITPTIQLPRRLVDTHPTDEHMRYTNYTLDFKETIDHIFVSDDLTAEWTFPQPSEDDLAEDVALPSVAFPSDHIALVADLVPAAAAGDAAPADSS